MLLGRVLATGIALGVIAAPSCGARRPNADEAERLYAGPIRSTDVERGRSRYAVVCAPCHAGALPRTAPPLFDLGWSAPEIRHQIREGNILMPPIRPARLSDADMESLLAFFVTIGTVVEEVPDAGVDAGFDVGFDVGFDGGFDGGPTQPLDPWGLPTGFLEGADALDAIAETGLEASLEASPDAGLDAGPDAGLDAGIDAGMNALDGALDAHSIDAFDAGLDTDVDAREALDAPDAGVDAPLPRGRDLARPTRP